MTERKPGQPLANVRHERFAQYRAAGMPKATAYERAGYEPDTGNAVRLTGNDSVSDRTQEVLASSMRAQEVTPDWLIEQAVTLIQRGKNENARTSAIKLLMQVKGMLSGEAGRIRKTFASPEELCQAIALICPDAAALLAIKLHAEWPPEVESLPDVREISLNPAGDEPE